MNRNTKNSQNKRPSDGFFRKPKFNRVTPTETNKTLFKPREHQSESSEGFFVRSAIKSSNKNDKSSGKKDESFRKNDESSSKNFGSSSKNIESSKDTEFSSKNVKFSDKNGEKNKRPFDKKAWRLQRYSKKYKLDQWEGQRKKVALREYYKQMKDEPTISVEHLYKDDDEINDNENNLNANTNNERITLDNGMITQDNEKIALEERITFDNKNSNCNVSSKKKRGAFIKARMEYDEIKERKVLRKEEMLKKKEERSAAIKEAKRKKIEKYKKLNQRTKKSQPIMKYRMEMLLEEIQEKLEKEK